jgi:nitrogen fixation NifU-like protein
MPVEKEEDLYQDRIQDYYETPYHRGRCPGCTHAHQGTNPLCGDVIRVELQIDEQGKLKEVYFNGDGCCISQAAASMLVEKFDGKQVEDVKRFSASEMLDLFGVRLTPNRQKCCLLCWRVLQAAVYSPLPTAARGTGILPVAEKRGPDAQVAESKPSAGGVP